MKPIGIFWVICALMFLSVFVITSCQSREDRYWTQVSEGLKHV